MLNTTSSSNEIHILLVGHSHRNWIIPDRRNRAIYYNSLLVHLEIGERLVIKYLINVFK